MEGGDWAYSDKGVGGGPAGHPRVPVGDKYKLHAPSSLAYKLHVLEASLS